MYLTVHWNKLPLPHALPLPHHPRVTTTLRHLPCGPTPEPGNPASPARTAPEERTAGGWAWPGDFLDSAPATVGQSAPSWIPGRRWYQVGLVLLWSSRAKITGTQPGGTVIYTHSWWDLEMTNILYRIWKHKVQTINMHFIRAATYEHLKMMFQMCKRGLENGKKTCHKKENI